MILWAGKPRNQSVNFYSGPFRLLGTIDGNSTTAPTNPATLALNAANYPLVIGSKTDYRIRVSRADGRLSAVQTYTNISVT
jgi:hypothetical protein